MTPFHAEVARLWGAGLSIAKIAEATGRGYGAVVCARRSLALPRRTPGRKGGAAEVAVTPFHSEVTEMWTAGKPLTAIASKTGRTVRSVVRARLSLALPGRPSPIIRGHDPDADRAALPAGHPASWNLINEGLCLAGTAYPDVPWLHRNAQQK